MYSALEIVNISDVGRKRPHNEDSTVSDSHNGLVVLADGMGGYNAGEVASAIAVMTVLHDVIASLKNANPVQPRLEPGISRECSLI